MPFLNCVFVIVDDHEICRKIIRFCLAGHAHNTTFLEAENGKEALEKILDYKESKIVLFTDIEMPIMGGRQLINKIMGLRNEFKLGIDIVVVSSLSINSLSIAEQEAIAYYIEKPTRKEDIEQALDKIQKKPIPEVLA